MSEMFRNPPTQARRATAVLSLALLLGIGFAGCLGPTQGTVSVFIRAEGTDEFTTLEMTFTRVEVQRAGAGIGDGQDPVVDRGADDDPATETPPRLISNTPVGVDLLQFQEAASRAHLGDTLLSEGSYSLVIVRVAEEITGTLRADGSQVSIDRRAPEIRHLQEFTVEAAETTRLIITIDLEESITQTEEGNYRFSPRGVDVQVEPRAQGAEETVRDRGV